MCALHAWVGVMSVALCALLIKVLCESRGKGISFLLKTLMNAAILSVSTAAHPERSREIFHLVLVWFSLCIWCQDLLNLEWNYLQPPSKHILLFGLSKTVDLIYNGECASSFHHVCCKQKSPQPLGICFTLWCSVLTKGDRSSEPKV